MSSPPQVQCSSPTSFYLSLFWGCGGGDGSLGEVAYFSSNLHSQVYLLLRRLMRYGNWCHTCPMLPRCRCKTICFLGCCSHMLGWHCLSMTRGLALQFTKLVWQAWLEELLLNRYFFSQIPNFTAKIIFRRIQSIDRQYISHSTFKPLSPWTAFFNLSVIACLDGKKICDVPVRCRTRQFKKGASGVFIAICSVSLRRFHGNVCFIFDFLLCPH